MMLLISERLWYNQSYTVQTENGDCSAIEVLNMWITLCCRISTSGALYT